jgi:cytochrome oxidase Cu insertion factor (SCO1/SenC/PrrC family)
MLLGGMTMRKHECAVTVLAFVGIMFLPGCVSPEKRKAADQRMGLEEAQRKLDAKFKGKPAPDFELAGFDGQKVKLSDQQGKPVLLAFFSFQ